MSPWRILFFISLIVPQISQIREFNKQVQNYEMFL